MTMMVMMVMMMNDDDDGVSSHIDLLLSLKSSPWPHNKLKTSPGILLTGGAQSPSTVLHCAESTKRKAKQLPPRSTLMDPMGALGSNNT